MSSSCMAAAESVYACQGGGKPHSIIHRPGEPIHACIVEAITLYLAESLPPSHCLNVTLYCFEKDIDARWIIRC